MSLAPSVSDRASSGTAERPILLSNKEIPRAISDERRSSSLMRAGTAPMRPGPSATRHCLNPAPLSPPCERPHRHHRRRQGERGSPHGPSAPVGPGHRLRPGVLLNRCDRVAESGPEFPKRAEDPFQTGAAGEGDSCGTVCPQHGWQEPGLPASGADFASGVTHPLLRIGSTFRRFVAFPTPGRRRPSRTRLPDEFKEANQQRDADGHRNETHENDASVHGSAVEEPRCSLDHFLGSGSQSWRLDLASVRSDESISRSPPDSEWPGVRGPAGFPISSEGGPDLPPRGEEQAAAAVRSAGTGLRNRFGRAGAFVGVLARSCSINRDKAGGTSGTSSMAGLGFRVCT